MQKKIEIKLYLVTSLWSVNLSVACFLLDDFLHDLLCILLTNNNQDSPIYMVISQLIYIKIDMQKPTSTRLNILRKSWKLEICKWCWKVLENTRHRSRNAMENQFECSVHILLTICRLFMFIHVFAGNGV